MPETNWLNDIKGKVRFVDNGYWNGINMDDLKNLIECAEQRETATKTIIKLGKKIDGLQEENIMYSTALDRKGKVHDKLNKDYIVIRVRNRNYEEKLKEIMLKEHEYMDGNETSSFTVAKEALGLTEQEVKALLNDKQERKCRVCGCTNNNACTDGPLVACWWVEHDLCSSCEGEKETEE